MANADFFSQTELGLNIYATVSDVRDGVADTHTVVADTHAMVSDIRRKVLEGQEGAGDQRPSVSGTQTVCATKYMLTVTQNQTRSENLTTNESSILYLDLGSRVNHLPRRQGPITDVGS